VHSDDINHNCALHDINETANMVAGTASDPVVEAIIANDKTPWYKKPNLRYLYLFLVPCCMGIESTSGFDSSLMNGLQSLKYWTAYFGNPTGASLGILNASYSLGAITSLPFVTYVSDHVGRRGSILFGSSVMVIGAIMQAFSVNFAMWIVSRMILGHGIVYCIVAGSALLGELGHPKERAFLGSYFNAFYYVGSVTAAGIVLETLQIQSDWCWRLPSILQAVPSTIQIATVWFIPESPRYLVSKDKSDEALAILIKYHAEGDETNELPHVELAQIKSALTVENASRKRGWAELFQSSGMRRRCLVSAMLGLFTQFSGNGLITSYLVVILQQIGWTNPKSQNQLNVGIQGWSLLLAMTIASLATRFPRRRMYLLCACSLILVYTAWCVAQSQSQYSVAAGNAVIAFMFLYWPAYIIGYNALTYVYLIELFPFYVRTKGVSWFQLFGRCAGFFSTFVNPIGLGNLRWKYLLVYIAWLAFEIVFIWFFFPETHNRTLEELAFLFESEEEKARIVEESKIIQQTLKLDDGEKNGPVTHTERV